MKEINEKTRHQFIRDYKLPIGIISDEYFFYYLDLYEEHYKSRSRYEQLKKEIKEYGSLESFLEKMKEVKNEAIDYVNKKESYQRFKLDRLDEYKTLNKYPKKSDLYKYENKNKIFVSIDLVKANVQSLNWYDSDILGGSETYEDFIGKFTDSIYIKSSKQIRQVIFGVLQPKKQKTIQKFLMNKVKDELINAGMAVEKISFSSPDEVVFELDNTFDYKTIFKQESLKDLKFHVEEFKLEALSSEDNPIFIKRYLDGSTVSIKKAEQSAVAEVVKYLKSEPLEKKDLAFMNGGRLSFFNEPLFYK